MEHDPQHLDSPVPPPVSPTAQAERAVPLGDRPSGVHREVEPPPVAASPQASPPIPTRMSSATPTLAAEAGATPPPPPFPPIIPPRNDSSHEEARFSSLAPVRFDTTTDSCHLRLDDEESTEPLISKQEGWSVFSSAVTHAILLMMLALWMFPPKSSPTQLEVSASYGETLILDVDEPLVELEAFEAPEELDFETPDVMEPTSLDEPTPTIDDLDLALLAGPDEPALPTEADPSAPDPSQPTAAEAAAADIAPPSEALAGSGTIEGAVDRVTHRIRGKLADGDVLVVWLLDSSHSLVDDRKRVAERLTPFYEELAAGRESTHELMNAVVSFGAKVDERIPPTTFGPRVAKAVEKLPVDASGKEMVFTAIQECVLKYRKRKRDEHLMIVVWTDETGDDSIKLEPTIELCKRNNATVAVVGPSSVLGADTGFHSYVDPKTKRTYQLPVARGPDAAAPERLAVDYWFSSRGPQRGRGMPSWYGGPQLKGIASGFSPFSLTRLAIQTQGEYTIFDRPSDRGPFQLERMKAYLPEYGSVDQYERELASRPLRKAVMRAVRVTLDDPVTTPTMMLFAKTSPRQPGVIQRVYYPPAQFAAKLQTAKRGMIRQSRQLSETVDKALEHLSNAELESAYVKESPRWKAWHDLTKGRLLAVKVRLEEYRLTCESLSEGLNPSTNHIVFRASLRLRSDSKHHQLAKEAERLLMRCVADHPDTPWAYLADRELEHGLGVAFDQMSLRLVRGRGGPGPAAPNLPNF